MIRNRMGFTVAGKINSRKANEVQIEVPTMGVRIIRRFTSLCYILLTK